MAQQEKGNDQLLKQAGVLDEVTRQSEIEQAHVLEEERRTETAAEDDQG